MEIPSAVLSRLRRIDLQSLIDFAGVAVVRAIQSSFETNQEGPLATVLFYKYGHALLADAGIRGAVLDSLTRDEIGRLCALCDISGTSPAQLGSRLSKYFRAYSPKKSKLLVDFLGFPPSFYLHPSYDERESVELVDVTHGQQVTTRSYLHSYQKRVKDSIAKNLKDTESRFVVQMPTGAGKTYTALEAVVDVLRSPSFSGFVVWLVDSNELCEQARETFRAIWTLKGDAPLHIFRLFSNFDADFRSYTSGIVFAGFDKMHSVCSDTSHECSSSVWHLIKQSRLVVVDEAHSAVAQTRQQVIDSFAQMSLANIIGLTATPARAQLEETEVLSRLFHGRLVGLKNEEGADIEDPVAYLQAGGYLAHVDGEILETNKIITESQENRLLAVLASDPERNVTVMNQIELAHKEREATLVFACTKDHVFALRVLCEAKGIPVEHITGEVPQRERIKILDRFKRREFFILLNLDILATGIDVPNVNKLILARPVGSPIQYSQILGRALRGPKNGGNHRNTIVNIKDNLCNYPQSDVLYTAFADQFVRGK